MIEVKSSVIELKNKPCIISCSSVVGQNEGCGPLGHLFDHVYENDGIGQSSWENAESELLFQAKKIAMEKARLEINEIDVVMAGDLLNQCTASTYANRNSGSPFVGLFGACSTMALSLGLTSIFVDGGYADYALAAVSSHFCSAEKQFRYPLEYGCQRAPSSQRTVTGAGAFIVGKNESNRVYISRVLLGRIVDLGITDTSNMGAAMAPAAAESVSEFFKETKTSADDYSLILTGDLGKIGSELLKEYLYERKGIDISKNHSDCGKLIFDSERQNVNSGGSGCACSAVVLASLIMNKLKANALKKVLFVGTGALMSPLTSLQGETIPAVAHIVELNSFGG